MMLSLRRKVENKNHSRKGRIVSNSHSEDDLSTTSDRNNNLSSGQRRIASASGVESKPFTESDKNNLNDIDSAFSSFNIIFDQLKSCNPEERLTASHELQTSLISITHELSIEQFQRFSNALNNKIFELIHGSTTEEKIGGILAVDTLISFYSHTEELPNQISRLANYLRMLIPSNDIEVMRLATATLGKLAIPGGTITSDFVELEVNTSLEWLTSAPENTTSGKNEYRKHAALLIIGALADNSPYLLYPYVNSILDHIWKALRDNKLAIRIDAATMLGKCLKIVKDRNIDNSNEEWVKRLFTGCAQSLELNTTESIHATLLVYRELLTLEKNKFLGGKINEIFRHCMNLKNHKVDVIRLEVYTILPLLASFDKKTFIDKYLNKIMDHYLMVFKNMKIASTITSDKAPIFVSIGDIAFQVSSNISSYLDQILELIRESLKSKFKIRKHYEKEIFYCIGQLGHAMGPALAKYLNKDLLGLVLSCTLSEHMQKTLSILVDKIPALESTVNSRLLSLLCASLSGEKYIPGGILTPTSRLSLEKAREWRNRNIFNRNDEPNDDIKDSKIVIQALRMIQTIKTGDSLVEFARLVIMSYIEHENPMVRKLAALTVCSIYSSDPICQKTTVNALRSVSEVLCRLLTLAITDPVTEIRLEILQNLGKCYDPQLAQPDNLRILFAILNDEVFSIQKQTMIIIGRLSLVNPAYVVPLLRKSLLELMTELKYSSLPRKKEESLSIMKLLIGSSKDVTKPYMHAVVDILLEKIQESSSTVAEISLGAIAQLSIISGDSMTEFLPPIMKIIIKILRDSSNSLKRDASLKALGQIASSSGYVIQPFLDYPELLGILLNILKTESALSVRNETVRLIGILGALDPYKHREIEITSTSSSNKSQDSTALDIALLMEGISPSKTEYYPTLVIGTLLKMLSDVSLSTHHTAVVQAIMHIFQTLGMRCIHFLGKVVPGMVSVMSSCPLSLLEFYFQQMSALVLIVKQHIKPYVNKIFEIIIEFFPIVKLQISIISLIESISRSVEEDFKEFVPLTLTYFLNVLENDKSAKSQVSTKILKSLIAFGTNLEDYSYLIMPTIVRISEFSQGNLRKSAIVTIGKLAKSINLSNMSARIIHSLIRTLNINDPELNKVTMNTLCLLLLQMNTDFIIFVPIIYKTLVRHRITHSVYDQLVFKLLNHERLPTNIIFDKEIDDKSDDIEPDNSEIKKLPVNQSELKACWASSQQRTKEDWQEWFRRLSIQLLKESPSHSLRACSSLVSVYYPLARELFNSSFSSCWHELTSDNQRDLTLSIETVLSHTETPADIYQILLNLIEFMEHNETPLPISVHILGQYAEKCHAYAKALHYKELEFVQDPSTSTVEALININNQLHQSDSSIGILKYAQIHHDLQLKETWYEKLQRWEDALHSYNEREKSGENTPQVLMGKLRSLYALGEFRMLSDLISDKWLVSRSHVKKEMAPLAAGAAWALNHWDVIEQYIDVMSIDSIDREFFNAVLCLHRNNFEIAEKHIEKAREKVVAELSGLVNESYNRVYNVILKAQSLSELEEVIRYKKYPHGSENRAHLIKTLNKRLLGVQKNIDVWQNILQTRSLIMKPSEDADIWIKFANLNRKAGRMGLAKKVLDLLLRDSADPDRPNTACASPQVMYAQLKYLWAEGKQSEALEHLVNLTAHIAKDVGYDPKNMITPRSQYQAKNIDQKTISTYISMLSRCFLKQGDWRVVLEPEWGVKCPDDVLSSYLLAAHFNSGSYKAWHNWALANFEVISILTSKGKSNQVSSKLHSSNFKQQSEKRMIGATAFEVSTNESDKKIIERHVIPAIKGFLHSISLSKGSSLQDALRLLTLWFTFGSVTEVAQSMHEGFGMINVSIWLEVLPQLISRIHQPNELVSKSLLSLLSDLGKAHPQALVYPLTVAIKSESVSRQKAAMSIITKMKMHSPVLVEQADLVSNELIRVAVLWHEQWYEGLENASRLYFAENNAEKMFEILEPLHEMLESGAETLREISFQNSFGIDLNEANDWIKNYKKTKDESSINQAWDIYYNVFRRISKLLPQLQTLELQHVSPRLLSAENFELAAPGTYAAGKPIIRIGKFESVFTVISSKQRPRKFTIKGSDGKDYQYLLKGHEDIRQDSLVMQLFGLVNTLLQNDPECFRRHLDIQQYPAIPLSPKSGLLGWVPNSDTFHTLIKEYRDANKIPLNIEHWVMLQMAPDYDNLELLQKVEVFQYAMENTKGNDLQQVLWLKSKSSEFWLERRTIYTRSLAVMSMTGYILGLGDRHPSNLMLDRITGKIIHIDFGDCFEAAILREKFPEKVPFRLTRMLTNAMEIGGIEGSFRITAENVMRVLRDNKESLMAILEAFAFDPLIHWGFDLPTEKIIEQSGIDLPLINPSTLIKNGAMSAEDADILETQQNQELRNARAMLVLKRITDKLTGNDIRKCSELDIPDQVDKLIQQATSVNNLCQHYIGWCPFW